MKNTINKSTIESWCMKNGFTLDWYGRKVNAIPFVLADGDLYLQITSEPTPAFSEKRFVELVQNKLANSVDSQ